MPLSAEEIQAAEVRPVHIGRRLELLADGYLVYALRGSARLHLHRPTPQEVVLEHDAPWEGNTCAYHTIYYDEAYGGPPYRMTYRGSNADLETHEPTHPPVTCYAESEDGIHWTRPTLNRVSFRGSKKNNIILVGLGVHNFTPFRDENLACDPAARYKAVGGHLKAGGLFAFQSPDGINWSLMRETPIITAGTFDSQNLAFWDAVRGEYRAYIRDFLHPDEPNHPGGEFQGVRGIKTATSQDFLHWTEPTWLDFGGSPLTHLYTNAVQPYPRAPHLYVGFPTRFVPERGSLTEGLFMISRDGRTFVRWDEAIIRPNPYMDRWHNRSNYIWWGLVTLPSAMSGAPPELSLYTNEHYYQEGGVRIRRFTYRQDGFVSVRADYEGGDIMTKPLIFDGRYLAVNASTAAAGDVRVELQRPDGRPLEGYTLADCQPLCGDVIEDAVRWQRRADVGALVGQALRLRFVLRDADLYAFRFQETHRS